jgi:hypothetical protein
MIARAAFCLVVLASTTPSLAQTTPPTLIVSTVVVGTDGSRGGSTLRRAAPSVGQTISLEPHSGATLCESDTREQAPAHAAVAWSVNITTVSISSEVTVLKLDWKRISGTDQALRTAVVQLTRDRSVLLDYVPGAPSDTCQALGIGVQVELDNPQKDMVVESTLKLVSSDGKMLQTQIIRTRVGRDGEAFFDPVPLQSTPSNRMRISAEVRPDLIRLGAASVRLKIASAFLTDGTGARGGSSGYDLVLQEGKEQTFPAPGLGLPTGERLTVAITVRVLR